MPVNHAQVAGTVANGAARAGDQKANQSAFDVWTNTGKGISENTTRLLNDPIGSVKKTLEGRKKQAQALAPGEWDSASTEEVSTAFVESAKDIGKAAEKLVDAKGPLEAVGAVFGAATALEQMLSVPFSMIPFPALPGIKIMDTAIGLPHAHLHPPNLIPPAPPVPLPSAGPVIPIPLLSGASTILINGMPAARCGDMGIGIWCGGYFPMYEIFLGSSSVWVEGARAARLGVDITKHCIFTTPRPTDPPVGPMVGFTVSSSPNVSFGGIPMPSLTSMAVGKLFKAAFKGISKLASKAKAVAKSAKELAESALGKTARIADEGISKMADDASEVTKAFRKVTKSTIDESLENYQRAVRRVEELQKSGAVQFGGDPALAKAAETDMIRFAMSNEGKMLMDDIANAHKAHGTSVHINAQPAGTYKHGPHASAAPGWGVREADGTKGAPANSTVTYTPGVEGGGAKGTQYTPSDVVLAHELHHANANQMGNNSVKHPPTKSGYPNMEEELAVATENSYRKERGLPQRKDYSDLP